MSHHITVKLIKHLKRTDNSCCFVLFQDISHIITYLEAEVFVNGECSTYLGRIPFETFQEEEYLEEASRTPPVPVQMEQKLFYSRINVQSPSKSIRIIPAIPALPAIPLSEVE